MGLKRLIPQKLINLFWHLPQAVLANLIYGFPGRKLTVIGITGTSGKTSVCHLLHHILQASGLKVALISTIS
ncbi:UDP-N-acetylmuramoyl-L-alanyl-D-glutamate--2,6-diaminopimelate ligase, partial [Patescibacteria group bacterium]|nr:UDP-N-acetylmuramoyl-L-alanyl-D-glutamate--2,6-diaminopimelate ligase [Patescibacteria group bacterium]